DAGRAGHAGGRSRPTARPFDGSFGSASATPELLPPGPRRRGSRTPPAGSWGGGNLSLPRRLNLAASARRYANMADSPEKATEKQATDKQATDKQATDKHG